MRRLRPVMPSAEYSCPFPRSIRLTARYGFCRVSGEYGSAKMKGSGFDPCKECLHIENFNTSHGLKAVAKFCCKRPAQAEYKNFFLVHRGDEAPRNHFYPSLS